MNVHIVMHQWGFDLDDWQIEGVFGLPRDASNLRMKMYKETWYELHAFDNECRLKSNPKKWPGLKKAIDVLFNQYNTSIWIEKKAVRGWAHAL